MSFSHIAQAAGLAVMLVLPAASALQGTSIQTQRSGEQVSRRQRGSESGGPGSFSAPEIEVALLSSALLVVAGAALILRDRRARRRS